MFQGGLSIHTTLDPDFQQMAEDSVASILPDTDGKFTAALVTVEPGNGAVRALVGGSDFAQTKFNLVTDTKGRQTGSSFKPFTLVAALENGLLAQRHHPRLGPVRHPRSRAAWKASGSRTTSRAARPAPSRLTDATVSS